MQRLSYVWQKNASRVLKSGGHFITSGIINQKKQEVKDAILLAGFEIVETIAMEDWLAIIARKK